MLKEVWFDGGRKCLGEVETEDEARELGWKFLPESVKIQTTKEELNITEFKTTFIVI